MQKGAGRSSDVWPTATGCAEGRAVVIARSKYWLGAVRYILGACRAARGGSALSCYEREASNVGKG